MPNKTKYHHTILFKVGASILLPAILLSTFMLYLIYKNIEELTEEKFINQLHEINLNFSDYITEKLDELASKVKLGASEIEEGIISEDSFLELTNKITNSDELIYGSAIALAPNIYGQSEMGFYYSYKSNHVTKQIQFNSQSDDDYFDYINNDIDWWKTPSSSHHSGWTLPYFDQEAGHTNMVTFYQPFFNNGHFMGIITVDVSLSQLKIVLRANEELFENEMPTKIFLFSNDSSLVYSDNMELIGKNILNSAEENQVKKNSQEYRIISNAIAGKTGVEKFYSESHHKIRFAFYTPITSTNWSAIAIIPYDYIEASIWKKMARTSVILLPFAIVLLLLIYFITKSITNPIRKLSKASMVIASGIFDAKIDIKTKSELGLLANNFNKMSYELKQREEDLLSANKELRVLDDSKTKFLLLISHEIRTPLNGIMGFTQILKESLEDPELIELGNLLEQSAERLDQFSRKALDITQLQTNFNTLEKTNINIADNIERIIELNSTKTKLRGIKIQANLDLDIIHSGFLNYFSGILEELIENAITHSHPNTEVKIRLNKNKNGYASFCIKNQGEIIPSEKLKLVLKPFGLAEDHIDKNIGLGLYYVKTYLEIHNAEFLITSDVDGTIFRFDLMS